MTERCEACGREREVAALRKLLADVEEYMNGREHELWDGLEVRDRIREALAGVSPTQPAEEQATDG